MKLKESFKRQNSLEKQILLNYFVFGVKRNLHFLYTHDQKNKLWIYVGCSCA